MRPAMKRVEITHRWSGKVLYSCEVEDTSEHPLREAVVKAVDAGANLARANLAGAYLARANLDGAYLDGANLDGANLAGAYLDGANLDGAYLARANLDGANLDGAYLAGAYLARAYLTRAYLARANLDGANLDGANLAGANLDGAYLAGAYLARANLAGAYLARANLAGANLARANLAGANRLPAPAMILAGNWGEVPADLCVELMRWDAANHPDPAAFDRWAAGGACPYDGVVYSRASWFTEKRALWSPGPAMRPYDLMTRLLAWSKERAEKAVIKAIVVEPGDGARYLPSEPPPSCGETCDCPDSAGWRGKVWMAKRAALGVK